MCRIPPPSSSVFCTAIHAIAAHTQPHVQFDANLKSADVLPPPPSPAQNLGHGVGESIPCRPCNTMLLPGSL